MAFFINPDGTITTVEADYDRNGNLKPKINAEVLKEQVIEYSSNSVRKEYGSKGSVPKKNKPKVNKGPYRENPLFMSTAEIEQFFKDRIANNKRITTDEYIKITDVLPRALKSFFISRYRRYLYFLGPTDDDFRRRTSFKKPKNKKKAAKKNKVHHEVRNVNKSHLDRSGYSLGEIATVSSWNKRTPDGDMVNGRSLLGASRKPKYGYARDRFGRVQERDSFNEDRRNEFYAASKHQKNYDYSSYDENDDHDGAYNEWE